MADKDKSKISDKQLDSIGMSRAKWEELTSYYSKLMDKALDKPSTGILKPTNFMKIYDPDTELVDEFSSFVTGLSSDPQIKNLFVEDMDKKFTPLGNDSKMGFKKTLQKNYDFGDEDDVLGKFKFAKDTLFGESDEEKKITSQGGDINAPRYQGFDPETKEESFTPPKEGDKDFEGPPRPTSTPKPNTDKVGALKAARDKQVRLSGAEGPYGYKGGYDQMVKDQSILKPTRLGQRDADGGFRLRSAAERQARIREGQFDMQEPQRIVMENFRNRHGDGAGGSRLDREIKQFQEDTGKIAKGRVDDPLKLESDTRAKEQMKAFSKTATDRQKVLDKYRVKEPEPMSPEVAKGFEDTEKNRKRMKKILGS